jgi:hypothetical protein
MGYQRFRTGRMAAARQAYRETLRLRPSSARAMAYYAASFLGPHALETWRRLRTRLRASRGHCLKPIRLIPSTYLNAAVGPFINNSTTEPKP